MSYDVRLTKKAEKQLSVLPKQEYGRKRAVLFAMETEPLDGDVVKLSGYDAYRKRVGAYRIIFSINDIERVVLIFAIVRRNEKTYRSF